jgi:hypothetical protein
MSITIYALAKKAGVVPQSLYTLARLGYLAAEQTECGDCGHKAWRVSDEVASEYLAKRAAKEAAK